MEAGKTRLARDTVRDTTRAEADNLKREKERLKQLVADLSLPRSMFSKKPKFPVWNRPETEDECHGESHAPKLKYIPIFAHWQPCFILKLIKTR